MTAIWTDRRSLHWHGDAFDLPRGAVHLARGDRTAVQAFRHERAWGLLFHLEADVAQVEKMAHIFAEEVARGGSSAAALAVGAERELPSSRRIGVEVFGRFAHLALLDHTQRPALRPPPDPTP